MVEVLKDPTAEIASSVVDAVPLPFPGEVAAAASESFPPVAALQHLIDFVHSTTGFSWWASIALTTLLIRGATIPLIVNQMKASIKLNELRPEMEELKERLGNTMDPAIMMENQKKMKDLFKKHGVNPLSPMKGLFIQGPVFISFFMAISNMVEKVPSFKGGGAFWFTDLTTPDPFYALPILTGLTFLATVELNMQEGMEGNPMAGTVKKFSRGMAVLTVPFTASFPKAIFCYWITSNLFSLVNGYVLRQKPVRKFFNIPEIVQQPANPNPTPSPSFSFFGSPKAITATSSDEVKESEPTKTTPDRKISSSSVVSQRIRNLEKQVKGRSNYKSKRK